MNNVPRVPTQNKAAIEFLRLHEARFVELYAQTIRECRGNFFANLDEVGLHQFAVTNVTGIIHRFEGIQISLERTEQNLFAFFRQGATLKDFTQLLDVYMISFETEVRALLANQPELAQHILQKMKYLRQAYGTTVAIAMSNYQHSL